jgi:hypothetical protein
MLIFNGHIRWYNEALGASLLVNRTLPVRLIVSNLKFACRLRRLSTLSSITDNRLLLIINYTHISEHSEERGYYIHRDVTHEV